MPDTPPPVLSPPRHYLDHASGTPMRPEAYEAMALWFAQAADPGRVHTEGRTALQAIEGARNHVGAYMGTSPRDVVFTGSATEALNWCIFAACGLTPTSRGPWGKRLLVSQVEHTAVLAAARAAAAKAKIELIELPVDKTGIVQDFDIPPDTALVAVQHVNHETGVIQKVTDIHKKCQEHGTLLLTDACQSVGIPMPTADFLVISAHKLGGPPGIGALALRRRVRIDALFLGGEQELGRRAGGENVAGAVGFGHACTLEIPDTTSLRDQLIAGISTLRGVEIFGASVNRAPHILGCSVAECSGEGLLIGMDNAGITLNSGSSCASGHLEPSHVHYAIGANADTSLRFSFGWTSTKADVDAVLVALPPLAERLRRLRTTPISSPHWNNI